MHFCVSQMITFRQDKRLQNCDITPLLSDWRRGTFPFIWLCGICCRLICNLIWLVKSERPMSSQVFNTSTLPDWLPIKIPINTCILFFLKVKHISHKLAPFMSVMSKNNCSNSMEAKIIKVDCCRCVHFCSSANQDSELVNIKFSQKKRCRGPEYMALVSPHSEHVLSSLD